MLVITNKPHWLLQLEQYARYPGSPTIDVDAVLGMLFEKLEFCFDHKFAEALAEVLVFDGYICECHTPWDRTKLFNIIYNLILELAFMCFSEGINLTGESVGLERRLRTGLVMDYSEVTPWQPSSGIAL